MKTPEKLSLNGKSYDIISLLGKGKGGYSYLATDGLRRYTLKKIHHEPCSYYTFGDKMAAELNDYKRLVSAGIRVPELIEADSANELLLKEYIEGYTVFELVRDSAAPEECLAQVREMSRLAYNAGLNIDYFPTNFIMRDNLLYYIDYECNEYSEEWSFENWGIRYWSKTKEFMEYLSADGQHKG